MNLNFVVINYHKHIVVNFQHESYTCKYPIGLTSLYHNIPNLFIIRIIATYNYELSSPQIKYNSISHFTQIKSPIIHSHRNSTLLTTYDESSIQDSEF